MTPDYINRQWTEELLQMMLEKRNLRIWSSMSKATPAAGRMSNQDFFDKHRIKVKHG